PHTPWASGVLVDGEEVVAVGRAGDLAAQQSRGEVVDLPGALVLPGLHDAHIHTANLARDLASVDLRGATSLQEALERVRAHVQTAAPGRWIFGGRWDANKWTAGRPDSQALDSVS